MTNEEIKALLEKESLLAGEILVRLSNKNFEKLNELKFELDFVRWQLKKLAN